MSNNKILLGATKVGNANIIQLRDNATKSVLFTAKSFPAGITTYLRFDEGSGTSTIDTTGGLVGTLSNANIWTTSGKNKGGVEFTTGQTISVPHSANFSVSASGSFSLSVWVYTKGLAESGGNVNDYILKNWETYRNFILIRDGDGYQFFMQSSDGASIFGVNSVGTWGINEWHHIVCTYDPAVGTKMYINGALNVTNATTATVYQNSNSLIIGSGGADATRFIGILDELGFWQKALTSDEVLDLYNNSVGNYN